MTHPILGIIAREDATGDGVATVLYGARTVQIHIIADEIPYDATVDVAASVVQDLEKLDTKAKQVAASDLTDQHPAND